MIYDLAIIGSGFAGMVAAKKAIEKGLKLCWIRKDAGATQHFSGAFDIIDPRWWEPELSPSHYPSLRLALDRFILGHPDHLYSKLEETQSDFSENLIAESNAFFEFYKIPVISDEKLIMAFGSSGLAKPTGFAMKTQGLRVSELTRLSNVLYLDFPYIKDYPVGMIEEQLKQYFDSVQVKRFEQFQPNRTASLASYLSFFDDREAFTRLKLYLKDNIGDTKLVLLPPVLGTKNTVDWHTELENELGIRVVELLSILPSASGIRFQNHLEEFLSHQDLSLINGEAIQFEAEGKKIQYITVKRHDGEEDVVMAKSYVLATGKFIGGGIEKTDQFRETVFQLPLFALNNPLSPSTRISKLLSLRAVQRQPFLDVGVQANKFGQPTDQLGDQPVYENLKACGHVLSGFDFTRDRCGFGISLATAVQCVQSE